MPPAATLHEPFLLSSYSVAQHLSKPAARSRSRRRQTSIYASYQKPAVSSDGFVSIAAQSDGVYVVDVATLHPVVSYTLGPSTSFACAPLTVHSKNTHTTFAVIASSPDVDGEHHGKTIWKWSESLSSPLVKRSSSLRSQHQALALSHLVAGLHDCGDLPDRILAISHAADISLLTTELELKTTRPASSEENNVLLSHVFSRTSCSFLGSAPQGAAVVLVVERGLSVEVEVYHVGTDDSIVSMFTHEVPLACTEFATASCSSSGTLNFISSTGSWLTFSLTSSAIAPISPPIQLKDLSFISTAPSISLTNKTQSQKTASTTTTCPSLLALTSSHVLLASQTTQNEIALLLWDSQFSVLLSSYILPLPSSLITQSSLLSLSLLSPSALGVKAGNQQAILVISPPSLETDGKTAVKSSIYVIPYNVPARSTLANAMGCAKGGARWLADFESGGKVHDASLQDAAKTKVVKNIRTAVEQNRPQVANALFTEWEKKEREKVPDSMEVMFGYTFVKDLLDAIIQPLKNPSPLYSSEVVGHLIEKGVVRSAMLDGGLLASLRQKNDWPSIDLALRYTPDLSENELIETLCIIINRASSEISSTDANTMQIDPTPSASLNQMPSLPDFLMTMLKHRQFTTQQLILAFRHHLHSAEAVTSVAQILDEWMKKVQSQEMKLLPRRKDITKNEHGVFVIKKDIVRLGSMYDLPTMSQILSFLQSLLDSSFLLLLQHPPANAVLKRLKSHIDPEIAIISQTEKLRGLVECFARSHAKTIKEAEASKARSDGGTAGKEGSKKDWRQRKREKYEQIGMAVGVYQLEELTL